MSDITRDPDTLLCAWWVEPCDEPAISQDLCRQHYATAWHRGDLPPTFLRHDGRSHILSSVDTASRRGTCYVCGPNVLLYFRAAQPDGRRGRLVCAAQQRAAGRLTKTGWTPEAYDLAVIEQGNRCALCGRPPVGRGKYDVLTADHCHATSVRRRLLCGWCNTALGLFGDDPGLLRAAAAYVER